MFVKIPNGSSALVTQLLKKLGAEITHKKATRKKVVKKEKPVSKTIVPKKKKLSPSIDHTFLFGKWKDFDIDAKKIRQQAWDRSHKF